jgi:2',3'-cyclic-nucleotide 2'-phosphodiesterase (5'-nucleotidase family)
MKSRLFLLWTTLVLTIATYGEKRDIHILATNDMHASISNFPQLAAIVDSLRAIDPALLVFSAGDNRTGDPLNDKYVIPAYPIVAMMNIVGFNASALGNHEFDSGSLPRIIGMSGFRYLCANIIADDSTGVKTVPYQVFDVGGLKVGVVGAIQVGPTGIPASHPDNLRGIRFVQAEDVLGQYEWMSRECDATILLSHLGYETDTLMAERFPWIDAIIGGHTHKQLQADEPRHGPSGVLVTQCKNSLSRVAYITLTVDGGHVVDKRVEYISVKDFGRKNPVVEALLDNVCNDPKFSRVIARAETSFGVKEELGCLMCDAYIDAFGTDFALANPGGVRLGNLPAGDITVLDALKLDPFDNQTVIMTLTGRQLYDLVLSICQRRMYSFPYVGGMLCELTADKDDPKMIGSVKLMTPDGKPLKKNRRYRVATNSYVSSTNKVEGIERETKDMLTNDLLIQYLEKQQTVSYKGVRRLSYKK